MVFLQQPLERFLLNEAPLQILNPVPIHTSNKSFRFSLEAAGLQIVENEVRLPKTDLRFWNPTAENFEGEPVRSVSGREAEQVGSGLQLLYFWSQGCEPCFQDMQDFRNSPKSELVDVVFVYTGELEKSEAKTLTENFGVLSLAADVGGVLAERAAVLGTPGVLLLDSNRLVLARSNGPYDFLSPGYELLLKWIARSSLELPKNNAIDSPRGTSQYRSEILEGVNVHPDQRVRILGVPVLSVIFALVLAFLCYKLMRLSLNRPKMK